MYEVDKLIKNNDIEKFKFIYFEWFNKDEKNIESMKKNITKKDLFKVFLFCYLF